MLEIRVHAPQHLPPPLSLITPQHQITYLKTQPHTKMPYPETTDAFAVTDIKNWSTFKRQEVSKQAN
jgi:hypothetical protein